MLKTPRFATPAFQLPGRWKAFAVAFMVFAGAAPLLHAWDDGYVKLKVPSVSNAPMAVEIDFAHSFIDLIPPSGANVRLATDFVLFNMLRAGATYLSKQQEVDFDLGGWLPLGPFRVGGEWDLVGSTEPINSERYWSQYVTLFASGYIVPDLLHAAVNIQYDNYIQAINGGLGVTVDIVPQTFSVVAEGMLSLEPHIHWGWDAALELKVGGHQFYLFVGSGNDLRLHTSMFAAALPDTLSAGFVIRRQIEIYPPDTQTENQDNQNSIDANGAQTDAGQANGNTNDQTTNNTGNQ